MQILRLVFFLLIFQTASLLADTAAVLPFANRTAVTNPTQGSLDWIGRALPRRCGCDWVARRGYAFTGGD